MQGSLLTYTLETSRGRIHAQSLVVACGGLSIPKIGATGFGYELARKYGHRIIPPRPGLVPLTFSEDILDLCQGLAGVSVEASVRHGNTSFNEGLLFTHRGLSGPSILQISSYWQDGGSIAVNLAPTVDASSTLLQDKLNHPRQDSQTALARLIPKRLASRMLDQLLHNRSLAEMADKDLRQLGEAVNSWKITPNGTEGYRTAEVTLGGVATEDISSQTMESRLHPGLFFIGEVVDVTGHLGGYNFQWAWSSGFAAGQRA
jgi:predicted Rossmann fold flavoprotein